MINVITNNEKTKAVIKTGRDLFWKFGINRVSVEEICKEAGVSKMTFYKYFKNKTELAIEIISQIFDRNMETLQNLLDEDIPYEEKMQKQLQMKLQGTHDISQEFVKDVFAEKNKAIHDYWEKRSKEAISTVINHYSDAQTKGWIRKDIKIDFILYIINKTFEFANDARLAAKYDNMQELIVEINKFFLYGIMPRPASENKTTN